MKTKKGTPYRLRMCITLSPETYMIVKEVAHEMKMSKSAFVEFMLTQMKRAEQLTIGEYVTGLIEDMEDRRKKKVLKDMEKIRNKG